MGLFGRKKEKIETEDIIEKSYMLAVPENESDIKDVKALIGRMQDSSLIEFLDSSFEKTLNIKVKVDGQEYSVDIRPYYVELPEMYRMQHFFKDVDMEKVANTKTGLLVEMAFSEDALSSYHAQLKIITAMMPSVMAVLDHGSEKILSGKWVSLAAWSKVAPAPRYIYTVQAVSDKDGSVWLHSHGLNRCNLPELEILDSNKDTYAEHYNIIETAANRMLDNGEGLEEKEPMFLAQVTDEIPLLITIVDWREAIAKYPKKLLGGKRDRKEGHNSHTCAIFCYPTPEALEAKEYVPVMVFDEYLSENPMYMLTNKETERMKALALERLPYMKNKIGMEDTVILVKIGLEVDEEFREDENSREHIWFELNEAKDGNITCTLTQEPYYVKDLHEGDVKTFPESAMTDWIILKEGDRFTPDDVYLFE